MRAWTWCIAALLLLLLASSALAETRALTGRVVDGKGKPVKGAQVYYYTDPSSGLTVASTADDGRFTLDIDAKAKCYLFVTAKGLAPAFLAVPDGAPLAPVTFTLAPGHRLPGILVDDTGKPITGASISPVLTSTSGIPASQLESCSSFLTRLQTDTQGHFVLTDLPAGTISLSTYAEGYASQGNYTFPVDRSQKITLRRLAKISGRIVRRSDGKPVQRFQITVQQGGGSSSGGVRSSPDGSFVAYSQSQQHGPVTLIIDAPGYWQQHVDNVIYSPDARPLIIRLAPAKKMTGRITQRENGKPLAGVMVSVYNGPANFAFTMSFDIGVPPAKATTGADGRFTVEVRVPSAAVTLQKHGYGRVLLNDVNTAIPLRATLDRGATIIGKVLDADGKPVKDASVRVDAARGSVSYFDGSAKADGSYTVTDLPSGLYIVQEESQRTTTVQATAGQTVAVEWHRETGITLHGTVTLSEGLGAGLFVDLGSSETGAQYSTTTDQHGQYALSLLAPGDYMIFIGQPGQDLTGLNGLHAISIRKGDNRYDLTLPCAVSGKLVDAQNGTPLANVTLAANRKSTWRDLFGLASVMEQHTTPNWYPINLTVTDAQGRFTIANLMPGEWLITRGAENWPFGAALAPPFTLQDHEHKTDILLQQPQTGTADISIVDARTRKAIAGVVAVCVDQWGNLIHADNVFAIIKATTSVSSTFRALPAGEYRVYPDRAFGSERFTEKYLVSSTTFTVIPGKTTRACLLLPQGGRLRVVYPKRGPKPSGNLYDLRLYAISKPGTDDPVLSDAQGPYLGGEMRSFTGKEFRLALPPGRYRLKISSMPINTSGLAGITPLHPTHTLLNQEITITPGKDTVVKVTQ